LLLNNCIPQQQQIAAMVEQMKIALIIPVYNHEQRLAAVLRDCLRLGMPIFVVDDGSTDETPAILARIAGITVLSHPTNLGKGAALLTGFAAAARTCDWAVTLDADGQHYPADCTRLIAAIPEQKRPIIIGARQGMTADHVPWTSRFGRGFSNFWIWVAGGEWVSDSQSGFRLYPLPEVLQLPVAARRFQYEVEVLVQAGQQQPAIPVQETAVRVVYQKRGERVSHFHPFVDFWRNSATFSRLIFSRIFSLVPEIKKSPDTSGKS
jgi:glycosyltransferase involved in cell wall biosynthesis